MLYFRVNKNLKPKPIRVQKMLENFSCIVNLFRLVVFLDWINFRFKSHFHWEYKYFLKFLLLISLFEVGQVQTALG